MSERDPMLDHMMSNIGADLQKQREAGVSLTKKQ